MTFVVTKNCQICKKAYQVNKSTAERSKFCSRECRGTKVTKQCQICKTEYQIKQSAAEKSKFCSRECQSKAKEHKVTLSCVECGTEFTVPRCHQDRKQRCSRECIRIFRKRVMEVNNKENDWVRKSRRANACRRVHHESGTVMRSGWEVTFAQWLDKHGLTWAYEPELFDLGEFSYLPDFWVEEWDSYIEIRPTWKLTDRIEKQVAFREAGYPLTVITEKEFAF